MGMRVREGRGFTGDDTTASQPVVVVNRTFAERVLQRACGGHGICRPRSIAAAPIASCGASSASSTMCGSKGCSYSRAPRGLRDVSAAVVGAEPGTVSGDADGRRSGARRIGPPGDRAPRRPVGGDRIHRPDWTIDCAHSLAQPRLYAVLLSSFAVFALTIAGIGLFGVLVGTASRSARARSASGPRWARGPPTSCGS